MMAYVLSAINSPFGVAITVLVALAVTYKFIMWFTDRYIF